MTQRTNTGWFLYHINAHNYYLCKINKWSQNRNYRFPMSNPNLSKYILNFPPHLPLRKHCLDMRNASGQKYKTLL